MAATSSSGNLAPAFSTPTATTSMLVLQSLQPALGVSDILLRPGRYFIGSDASCDIMLQIPGVARQHALILAGPQKTIIRTSDRRTWLNEGPVATATLNDGDRLQVGPCMFRVRCLELPEGSNRGTSRPGKFALKESTPQTDFSGTSPETTNSEETSSSPLLSRSSGPLKESHQSESQHSRKAASSEPNLPNDITGPVAVLPSSAELLERPISNSRLPSSQELNDQLREVLEVAVRVGIAPQESLRSLDEPTVQPHDATMVQTKHHSIENVPNATSVAEVASNELQHPGELNSPLSDLSLAGDSLSQTEGTNASEKNSNGESKVTPAVSLPSPTPEKSEGSVAANATLRVDELARRLHTAASQLLHLQRISEAQEGEIQQLERLVEKSQEELTRSEHRRLKFESESQRHLDSLLQREEDLAEWESILREREEDFRIRQSAHEARETDAARHYEAHKQEELRLEAKKRELDASVSRHATEIAQFVAEREQDSKQRQARDEELENIRRALTDRENAIADQRRLLELELQQVRKEHQKWEEAHSVLETDRRNLSVEREALRAILSRQNEQLTQIAAEREELKAARAALENERSSLDREISLWHASQKERERETAVWDTKCRQQELERTQIEQAARELARNRAEFGKQSQALDRLRIELEEESQKVEQRYNRLQGETARIEQAEASLERQRQELLRREDQLDLDRKQLNHEKQNIGLAQGELASERCSLTREREQLAIDRAELNAERALASQIGDQLTTSKDELAEVRAKIEALDHQLTARRVELTEIEKQMEREREELESVRQSLSLAEARLIDQRFLAESSLANLEHERQVLASEWNAFRQREEELRTREAKLRDHETTGESSWALLKSEHEEFVRKSAEIASERDLLISERDAWKQERAEFIERDERSRAKLAELEDSASALTNESHRLEEELAALKAREVDVAASQALLRAAQEELHARHRSHQSERDSLLEQHEKLLAANVELAGDRELLTKERDAARTECESVSRAVQEWKDRESRLEEERTALALEREKMRQERDAFEVDRACLTQDRERIQDLEREISAREEALRLLERQLDEQRATLEIERAHSLRVIDQPDVVDEKNADPTPEDHLPQVDHLADTDASPLIAVEPSRPLVEVLELNHIGGLPTDAEASSKHLEPAEAIRETSDAVEMDCLSEGPSVGPAETSSNPELDLEDASPAENSEPSNDVSHSTPVQNQATLGEGSLIAGFFRKKESQNQVESLRSQLAQMFDLPGKKKPTASDQESASAASHGRPELDLDANQHRVEPIAAGIGDPSGTQEKASLLAADPSTNKCSKESGSDDGTLKWGANDLESNSPTEDGSSPTPSAMVEEAAEEESISAYMEKLLARSRRHSEGESILLGQKSSVGSEATRRGSRGSERETSEIHGKSSSVTANLKTPDRSKDSAAQFDSQFSSTAVISTETVQPPPDPIHRQDKSVVKADLASFRQIANLSARSAIVTSAWRRMKGRIIVTGALTTVALVLGVLLLTAEFWTGTSYAASGWAALLVACVSGFELGKSTLLLHRMSSRRQESIEEVESPKTQQLEELEATSMEQTRPITPQRVE